MTPNDLGDFFLVEDCDKVSISDLLRAYKVKLKEAYLSSELEMMDMHIKLTTSKTGNHGTRFWFSCPNCKRRVGVLMRHPLTNVFGCRLCLNLEYRKRRFRGMQESKFG